MIPILNQFLTEISPHEVSGMNIVPMLNPLKFYNYSVELSKYAERINACSGILKFELIPIKGNWFSSKHFFAVFAIVLCVSGADLYFEGGYVSAIAKYSRTLSYARWVFLTSP